MKVISRRMSIRHRGNLERQEVTEIITLFNEGNKPIREFYFEMEDFRNVLSVIDDKGNMITFLTKEQLKPMVGEEISAKLDNNEVYICGIVLSTSNEIQTGEYKIFKLTYNILSLDSPFVYDNPLSVYKNSNFIIIFSFYDNETVSLSFDFEKGDTADEGLYIACYDKDNNDIDYDIEDKFHYVPKQRNITLSISARKRKEAGIQSVAVVYSIVPDKEVRNIIGIITSFSILFPFFIVAAYFHFKSLSLFGIMATTEFLSIVSLGIARFPSILIYVNRRLIISFIELVLVLVIILLIPETWLLEVWNLLISHL